MTTVLQLAVCTQPPTADEASRCRWRCIDTHACLILKTARRRGVPSLPSARQKERPRRPWCFEPAVIVGPSPDVERRGGDPHSGSSLFLSLLRLLDPLLRPFFSFPPSGFAFYFFPSRGGVPPQRRLLLMAREAAASSGSTGISSGAASWHSADCQPLECSRRRPDDAPLAVSRRTPATALRACLLLFGTCALMPLRCSADAAPAPTACCARRRVRWAATTHWCESPAVAAAKCRPDRETELKIQSDSERERTKRASCVKGMAREKRGGKRHMGKARVSVGLRLGSSRTKPTVTVFAVQNSCALDAGKSTSSSSPSVRRSIAGRPAYRLVVRGDGGFCARVILCSVKRLRRGRDEGGTASV